MTRANPDRAIMWAVIAFVAWAIIGLPAMKLLEQSPPNYSEQPAIAKDASGAASQAFAKSLAQEKQPEGHKEGKWYSTFLDHAPDWFVAVFTGLLVYVTYRLVKSTNNLWEAGERQLALVQRNFDTEIAENRAIAERNWEQMGRSISASIESAEAASSQAESAARQAKAAENSILKHERPYVLITNLSHIQPPKTTLDEVVTRHHIVYQVGNFGRIAALIHEIKNVFRIAESSGVSDNPFSGSPVHPALEDTIDAGYAIGAGTVLEQKFTLPRDMKFKEQNGWFDPDLQSGQTVFMFVRIRYEDVSGPVRDRVSTWKYDFRAHHFLKCGGEDHNYEREVDPA